MCFLTILDLKKKKHKRKMDYWVQSLLTPFWGFNFKLLYHYLIATAAYYAKISRVDQVPFPFYAHTPLHPKPKNWTPIHLKLLSGRDAFIHGNSDTVWRWWFTSHYNVAPTFYWYDQKYETPIVVQALCIFPCICREVYHAC